MGYLPQRFDTTFRALPDGRTEVTEVMPDLTESARGCAFWCGVCLSCGCVYCCTKAEGPRLRQRHQDGTPVQPRRRRGRDVRRGLRAVDRRTEYVRGRGLGRVILGLCTVPLAGLDLIKTDIETLDAAAWMHGVQADLAAIAAGTSPVAYVATQPGQYMAAPPMAGAPPRMY